MEASGVTGVSALKCDGESSRIWTRRTARPRTLDGATLKSCAFPASGETAADRIVPIAHPSAQFG
jgi:hypothetical protein